MGELELSGLVVNLMLVFNLFILENKYGSLRIIFDMIILEL